MTVRADDITSVITLRGSVRHLLDPKQRQPRWHADGGEQVTACRRRYWVVYDAQHDRQLCDGCRRWLSRAEGTGSDGDVAR